MIGIKSVGRCAIPSVRSIVTRKTTQLPRSIGISSFSSHSRAKAILTKFLGAPTTVQHKKWYSVLSTSPEAKVYNYENIKKIASNPLAYPDTVIVDVREPVEFEEGHIPGAINIPFKSSPGALDLSPEEFSENFGFDKPDKNKELVFYCLAGVRSSAAEDLANTFGYKKRGNYIGSYEDWATKENQSRAQKPNQSAGLRASEKQAS